MSWRKKFSLNANKWFEYLSKFNEDFIKSYNEKANEGYFLEVDVEYHESLHEHHHDLPCLSEVKKVDKVKKTCS